MPPKSQPLYRILSSLARARTAGGGRANYRSGWWQVTTTSRSGACEDHEAHMYTFALRACASELMPAFVVRSDREPGDGPPTIIFQHSSTQAAIRSICPSQHVTTRTSARGLMKKRVALRSSLLVDLRSTSWGGYFTDQSNFSGGQQWLNGKILF